MIVVQVLIFFIMFTFINNLITRYTDPWYDKLEQLLKNQKEPVDE